MNLLFVNGLILYIRIKAVARQLEQANRGHRFIRFEKVLVVDIERPL